MGRKKSSASSVNTLIKALQAKFGKQKATLLGAEMEDSKGKERLSTSVDVLDWYVLGNGGSPVGRMTELFGAEGSAKTSFGYSMVAQTQRDGGVGVWVVSPGEGGLDEERASSTFGVDIGNLVILYPEHLEEAFEQMKVTLGAHNGDNGPMLIVWDSIAGMFTADGQAREAGSRRVGDVPLVMSEELKKIIPKLSKHRAHLLAINQVRAKIGVMYGDNTTTPGGNAPKFYASQRIQILGGKAVKNSKNEHTAKIITMMAVKNRLGTPWRKAKVRFDYATGFNNVWSTVFHAKAQKLIKAREEGFSGPSREGLAVYAEALEKLGWKSRVPLPEESESDGSLQVDLEEDGEEAEIDGGVDSDDADD